MTNPINAVFFLQHSLGEVLHRLSHTQIAENLLGATKDGIELVRPVEYLDVLAHAGLGQTATTPDLDGLVGDFVGDTGDAHLEETDGAGEVDGLLLVGHVAHLVGDCFEPGLVGLDEGNHLGEPRE